MATVPTPPLLLIQLNKHMCSNISNIRSTLYLSRVIKEGDELHSVKQRCKNYSVGVSILVSFVVNKHTYRPRLMVCRQTLAMLPLNARHEFKRK